MNRCCCVWPGPCAWLLVIGYLLSAAPDDKPVFKAGFAERDITPEIGMEQPGGYGKAYHRRFTTRARPGRPSSTTARSGWRSSASTPCSSAGRPSSPSARRSRRRPASEPESILIGASHSHSSGPIGYYMPGEFDDASPLVR